MNDMNMLTVKINTSTSSKVLLRSETPLTVFQVWDEIQHTTAIAKENFYILYNGRLASNLDTLSAGSATITPRLLGGKGGFGSMLRAIGAQIEKTTNREACRDLSGRRLRDINEEKRFKLWMEKQSKKQDDASERKKKKLEKLCSEPKHEFKDQKYDEERSVLTERVADAVEEGFKAAAASSSGLKRVSETQLQIVKKKKVTLGFGLDLDSDELDSSDDDSNESLIEKPSVSEDVPVNEEVSANNTSDSNVSDEKSELNDISEKSLVSEKSLEDSSNNSVNIERKISSSDAASADVESNSSDVITEKRSENNSSNSKICNEEKSDSKDITTVEKVELSVSN